MIQSGTESFTTEDWEKEFQVSSNVYGFDLRRAVNLGFLRKVTDRSGKCHYELFRQLPKQIRCEDLTKRQRNYLTRLYRAFKEREFSVENSAMVLGQNPSSAYFHLINFAERGIMIQRGRNGEENGFRFAINPKEYPWCFDEDILRNASRKNPRVAVSA